MPASAAPAELAERFNQLLFPSALGMHSDMHFIQLNQIKQLHVEQVLITCFTMILYVDFMDCASHCMLSFQAVGLDFALNPNP